LPNIRTVQDLAALAYDCGVQLGADSLTETAGSERPSLQKSALIFLEQLERRIRVETPRLVDQLLLGWKEFAVSHERSDGEDDLSFRATGQ
jgi:hypothetical protein